LSTFGNRHGRYALAVIALSPLAACGLAGCGNSFTGPSALRPLFVAECGVDTDRVATEFVLLEWNSTTNELYPDDEFEPLDLSLFETPDGGTLAEKADTFKEQVRRQVTRIYCDYEGPGILVEHATGEEAYETNVVYMTQAMSPLGGAQVGEGEYDRCNRQHDNVAALFGGQILELSDPRPFDEWVLIFANVAAHEIGHTLGFGHVQRDYWSDARRSIYVELMLDGHTMHELASEQRFVVAQDSCTEGWSGLLRPAKAPTLTCSNVD